MLQKKIIQSLFSFALLLIVSISFNLFSEDKTSSISSTPTWEIETTLQKKCTTQTGPLVYTIQAGSLVLPAKEEGEKASLSFISYTAHTSQKQRPITFCFNGGPGSSSVWIHMGLLGPKKVLFPSPITAQNYEGLLVENPDTLLTSSDLVFIDPIDTGFSLSPKKGDSKEYYGIDEDASLFATFIERYLSEYQRWDSPKYLLGESYGTLRAVVLAKKLHETYRFDVKGLILISHALDLSIINSDPFEELSLVGTFPSIVLAAQSEGLLSQELQTLSPFLLYEKAKEFASSTLLPGLLNEKLSKEQLSFLAKECSKWTALPQDLIEKARLRFTFDDFRHMILVQKSSTLGRFDTRVHVTIPYHNEPKDDPSLSFIASSFTSTINSYFLKDLGLKESHPYVIMSSAVHQSWNWKHPLYPNFTAALQDLFTHMPQLKIYTATGLFDGATPPFGQELTLSRITVEGKKEQIQRVLLEGGHMMYLDPALCKKLSSDLKIFVE